MNHLVLNLLVVSYIDDFEQWKQQTLSFLNDAALEEHVYITLLLILDKSCKKDVEQALNKKIELHKIVFDTPSLKAESNIEMLFAPENKVKILSKLEQILTEKVFDFIQLESIIFVEFLENLRALSKAQIVYRKYFNESEIWEQRAKKSRFSLFKYLSFNKIANRIKNYEQDLDKLDYVISSQADILDGYTGTNRIIIPHKVDLSFKRKPLPRQFKLFFVGNLKYVTIQYSILWFLNEIWPKLIAKIPQIQFHIIGQAEQWFINLISLQSSVFYYPSVENFDEFIEDKTALILPYQANLGMMQEYALAMMRGKVLISTNDAVCCWGLTAMIHYMSVQEKVKFTEVIKHLHAKTEIQNYFSEQIYNFARQNLNQRYFNRMILQFYNKTLMQK